MRKSSKVAADELRGDYKRSDFGALVPGEILRATAKEL